MDDRLARRIDESYELILTSARLILSSAERQVSVGQYSGNEMVTQAISALRAVMQEANGSRDRYAIAKVRRASRAVAKLSREELSS